MTGRKKVPPAPVVTQTSVLDTRFSTPDTPTSHTGVTHAEEGLPVPKAKRPAAVKTTAKSTSRTPAGMIRQSVYTRRDAFAALMDAAERIVSRTNGFTTKADALAELILAGVADEERIVTDLRTKLQNQLAD